MSFFPSGGCLPLASRLWAKFSFCAPLLLSCCFVLGSCLLQPLYAQRFLHPGIPFTRYDLNQLKAHITEEPWLSGYNALRSDGRSQLNYSMRGPFETVSRVPNLNNAQWKSDMIAIHNLAFMWVFTGDSAYARKATNMLEAWATVNTTWGGGENMLDIGDHIPYLVTGADILRGTFPGWTATNTAHVKKYFADVLYPASWVPYTLRDHNKGALQLVIAVGIAAFLDDPVKWQQAIETYRMDAGAGLRNSLPNGEVGDAGRDDHYWVQIQALGWGAEVAWKQGVDLFAELDNRLLAIGELYNRYSIDPASAPFIPFGGYSAYYTRWGIPPGMQHQHPFNNIIEGAYTLRKGIATPYTTQMRGLVGEGSFSFLYLKSADTTTAALLAPIPYPTVEAVDRMTNVDIGNTGIAGSVRDSNGVWIINGAGNAIGNALSFTGKPVTGNVSIVAKIESNSLSSATSGVMIRESLSASSPYISINVYSNGTLNSLYNGGAGYTHYGPKAPWYLKIERVGQRVFTFHSQDGIHWTNNSLFQSSLPANSYIGVYTISNNTSAVNTAVFSDLAITHTDAAGAPAITSAAYLAGKQGAALQYAVTATNNPVVYRAMGLPAGLSIDSATGIVSGIPSALGKTAVTLEAVNAAGNSKTVLLVTVTAANAPNAPAGVTASVNNNTRIAVSWPAVANAGSYRVKRSLSVSGPFDVIQAGITASSYIDAQPVPEVNNYYVVTALAGELESSTSNVVFANVPPAVTVRPVVENGNNRLTLYWDSASGAVSYKISRALMSGGPYTLLGTAVGTEYTDTAVVNGVSYYYVIASVGTVKESVNSAEGFGVPGASSLTWGPNPLTDSLYFADNWNENRVPVNPAILYFGSSQDSLLTNDGPVLKAARIQFEADANAYTIDGNPMVLQHDLVSLSPNRQILTMPVVLTDQLQVNTPLNTNSLVLSGTVSGSGSLMKSGLGFLYLSGNNTYTGNTVINGSAGGWPPQNAIAIAGNGTGTPSAPVSGPLGVGRIIMNGGSIFSEGGDATLYNDIEVLPGKRSYMYETVNAITLKGRLLGSGTLEHDGNTYAGLHLQGDNSEFTGTFISKLRSGNQRVRFESPQSGSAKAHWLLDANGVDCQGIQFSTGTLHFGGLSGRGYIRNNAGGSPVISIGALNMNTDFGGTIVNFVHVDKVGTGTLVFSGSHSYGGVTTIKGGKFLLNNHPVSGTFTSPVVVEAGAFGGSGRSTAAVTVGTGAGAGAVLEPGNQAIGVLSIGALTMQSDAIMAVQVNPASNGDTLKTSSVVLNRAKLSVVAINAQTFPLGTSFMIVQNMGTAAVAGTFYGLPELAKVVINGSSFRITYKGGTGNDIVLLDERTMPPVIAGVLIDTAVAGRAYQYAIDAVNAGATYAAVGLPAGLQLDAATGILSGVPAYTGLSTVSISATSATGVVSGTLTLTVQSSTVQGLMVASGDGRTTLEWEPIAGVGYRVSRSVNADGPYSVIGNTGMSRYVDPSVSNGQVYYYVVAGLDTATVYTQSVAVKATPHIGQHGYWAFDETAGLRVVDAWGARHGAAAATALRDTGYYAGAIKLDGSAMSYVSLPAGVVSGLNDFTISTWVKMNTLTTWMRLFDFGTGTSSAMFLTMQAGLSGGKSIMRYAIKNNNSAEQQVSSNQTIPLNSWIHIAVTQSGNAVTLYVNGVAVAVNTNVSFRPATLGNTTLNYIGKSQFNDPLLQGVVDEFKIFNRALSASELQQMMEKKLQLQVFYADGDNGQTGNNSIRPYLKVVNNDTVTVQYKELTMRYWLTPENYSVINTWIDHAALGSSVRARYMGLSTPRSNALGYVEYSFDTTAGALLGGSNSGVIQSRLANVSWGNLDESNDHSFQGPDTAGGTSGILYALNPRITLYRNGKLQWGIEPALVTPVTSVKAYTQSISSGSNSTSTYLRLQNEGNIPVAYGDLVVRYWFTSGDSTPLNHWVDYAVLGNQNITGSFVRLQPALQQADHYLSLSIKPSAGLLYPLSNSGNIQYRIAKANWSVLDQEDDHSYLPVNVLTANGQVTVYHKGQLIWGIEPAAVLLAGRSGNGGRIIAGGEQRTAEGLTTGAAAGQLNVRLFPNPTAGLLYISAGALQANAVAEVRDVKGQLLYTKALLRSVETVSLRSFAKGVYHVTVRNGAEVTTHKIIKQS